MSSRLTATLARANGRATLWLARIAAVALAVIAVVTFCDVIGRYFFNAPFCVHGRIDARWRMAVLVYFGVGLVTHENGHISADVVWSRGCRRGCARSAGAGDKPSGARLCRGDGLAAVAAGRCICLQKGDTTQVWQVPLWPVAFAVAAGSVFLLTGVLLQLIARLDERSASRQRPPMPAGSVRSPIANSGRRARRHGPDNAAGGLDPRACCSCCWRRHADRLRDGAVGVSRHAVADRRAGRARAARADRLRDRADLQFVGRADVRADGLHRRRSANSAKSLYRACNAWLGHRRGGLALATIGGCGAFAAICGSSLATAATMAQIALPEMRRYGYDDRLATGSVAAGGTIGILIPPSIIMVIYGLLTETSISQLFLAGFLPGILTVAGFMLTIAVMTRIDPRLGPPGARVRAAGPAQRAAQRVGRRRRCFCW